MNSQSRPAKSGEAMSATAIIASIDSRAFRVGVIGLGYVGLPLALGFASKGFVTTGFDIAQDKIDLLMSGQSYINHIASSRVAEMLAAGRLTATTEMTHLGDVDAILICVPTPLTKYLDPDLSYVVSTCEMIAPHLKKGQIVALESTTYPGTTRDVMQPILEKGSGLKANTEFFIAYSPEREDPGNLHFETTTIPKLVGATSADGLAIAQALYSALVPQVVAVSSPEVAEAAKLTENIFRSVNIAMVNELKLIYDAMGIDVWEVIQAASSKPFGFMPFYPGPGLGGHCIPIDPFYLTWKAREFGMTTRFIELAGQINRFMPAHVVGKLAEALSLRQQKALSGARILMLGIAYKKNVDDMRESPALTLIELIEARGAVVDYHDPFISEICMTREHAALAGRFSRGLTAEMLAGYDAVLIVTDHDGVDYPLVGANARLIVDTRNACAKAGLSSHNVVKA